MFTITKEFAFSASHQLNQLPSDHKCHHLHGHNYKVMVELQAENLDSYGFVLDYGELNEFKLWLDQKFDHKHLNDELPIVPTAENLAYYFFMWCKSRWHLVSALKVSETDKTWAEYRP